MLVRSSAIHGHGSMAMDVAVVATINQLTNWSLCIHAISNIYISHCPSTLQPHLHGTLLVTHSLTCRNKQHTESTRKQHQQQKKRSETKRNETKRSERLQLHFMHLTTATKQLFQFISPSVKSKSTSKKACSIESWPVVVTTMPTKSKSNSSSKSKPPSTTADDCETSFDAISDILPLIQAVAAYNGHKSLSTTTIYDPYYCTGSVASHWARLGCRNFLNPNEDFYESAKMKTTPPHDVMVSNPPYSGDHIRRVIDFATKSESVKQSGEKTTDKFRERERTGGGNPSEGRTSSQTQAFGKVASKVTPFALLLPSHVVAQEWVGAMLKQRGLPPFVYVASAKQRYTFSCPSSVKGQGYLCFVPVYCV